MVLIPFGRLFPIMFSPKSVVSPFCWYVIIISLNQSRSSLYAEYARCVGPRNTRGPLALKDVLILVSFLILASGSENMNDRFF